MLQLTDRTASILSQVPAPYICSVKKRMVILQESMNNKIQKEGSKTVIYSPVKGRLMSLFNTVLVLLK
jgi:hypothetical protein